jgi:acyl-CoA thioester hydrolase
MIEERLADPMERYPVVIEQPVLWGHMDAFQHVNNAVYFRTFESARTACGDRVATAVHLTEEGIGPILASTSCDFLKPLRYPDTIRVGCRTNRLTASEMEQEYGVFSMRIKRLAALGTGRIVTYDYRALKRSTFPPALLERILRLQPELRLE